MRTTSMIVEHLMIGFQTFIWLLLFLATLFQWRWSDIQNISASPVIVAGMAMLIFYPLGVFIDEAADKCFNRFSGKIRAKYIQPEDSTFTLLLELNDQTANNYFQYVRSRIRLARSSALNFLIITVGSVVYSLSLRAQAIITLSIICVGATLTTLSIFAWNRYSHTYGKWTKRGFAYLQQKNPPKLSQKSQRK
jgi:hypothetical protein